MCTVVVRWSPGEASTVLALRDELTSRDFDDPGRWWPDVPDVVAGRDRQAGGTWCASRASTGVTALVLNRPQRRVASDGAPSRGVLPLLAARYEMSWRDHVDLAGMASFALVLVRPTDVTVWTYDGTELVREDRSPGTFMVTSGGEEDGKADRFLTDFVVRPAPSGWRALLAQQLPRDDPAALVVRTEREGLTFATVFGQVLSSAPGRLRVHYSRTPWQSEGWDTLAVP